MILFGVQTWPYLVREIYGWIEVIGITVLTNCSLYISRSLVPRAIMIRHGQAPQTIIK